MIAYMTGTVAAVTDSQLILEVNQIGYQIYITSREVPALPGIGETVKIYTYLNVKEDGLQLFGFQSEDDLEVFKLLIGVNGIGPKAALGILSVLEAGELRLAVLAGDAKTIARAPGVGNKTAQKLILELKDKFDLQDTFERQFQNAAAGGQKASSGAAAEAVEALTALGYSASDALRAVKKAETAEDMDTETILKLALKQMAFL
ncbi:MAG TPA: Holliday junction branch migration protein RuvA [Candidatus Choladousia intestinigallinarum]|nr:Holliday junction branch migration protein RuvA [Candidatus Choladousia intestinigallinarum]